MGKKFRDIYMVGMIFMFAISGCGNQGTADEITIYGQVTRITGDHITVALIENEEQNDKASGQLVLTGEEQVVAVSEKTEVENAKKQGEEDAAVDSIEPGNIITVVMDGADVKTITVEPDEPDITERSQAAAGSAKVIASGTIELTGILMVDGKSDNSEGETVTSGKENENVVLVKNGGTLSMSKGKLTKAGDTTSAAESRSFGVNAAFVTTADSESSISESEITSASEGANAIFAAGQNALVHASDIKVSTSGNFSSGLSASFGGVLDAKDIDITTTGDRSAPITASEGGMVEVVGGTVSALGNNSPCILALGTISMDNVTGSSKSGRAVAVEGTNAVMLNRCDLSGGGDNGIMFYKGTASEAEKGTAKLEVTDSKITAASEEPLFYIDGIQAKADVENTELISGGKVLVRVSGNHAEGRDTSEETGEFTLTGVNQKLEGDITCDELSSVSITLTKKSTLKGAVNEENKGRNVEISLDSETNWELTADSYVNVVKNEDEQCTNIKSNGYTVYYDKTHSANGWLNGKTITLSGGGRLTPL